jgi:hypothetical protein
MAKRSSDVILAEAEIGCILIDRLTQSVEGETLANLPGLDEVPLRAIEDVPQRS